MFECPYVTISGWPMPHGESQSNLLVSTHLTAHVNVIFLVFRFKLPSLLSPSLFEIYTIDSTNIDMAPYTKGM